MVEASKDEDEMEAAESRALRECLSESLWRRAVPAALLGGAVTLGAFGAGRLRPSPRMGPWPKVLGASFLAFWAGKVSYVLGRPCQDKFLRIAPDGPIAQSIRVRRGEEEQEEEVAREEDLLDVTIHTEQEQMMVQLSEREQRILEECRRVSLYYYSLPLSVLLGSSAYLAQSKGVIKESR